MSNLVEMQQRSLDFRRLSSNLLQSNMSNADVNLLRFARFIDDDPYIHDLLHSIIDGVDYDYKECFGLIHLSGWREIRIPVDESCHLKAQYDYIQFILSLKEDRVFREASQFLSKSGNTSDIIRSFLGRAFMPLISFITDAMSKEIINLQEHASLNVGNVYGNAIVQNGNGTVYATANVTAEATELVSRIDRILDQMNSVTGINQDELDSVKDDLESLKEQALSENPKPSRVKKVVAGIRRFGTEVLFRTAATLASNAISATDWSMLLSQADRFMTGLHM